MTAPLTFGSVCSGMEAASLAWNPLGWRAAFFSEIEKAPCALLKHHYPDTPNHGDMNNFREWPDHAIDLLCGGTPCQSFSIAGLRKGLADPRGSLMLVFGAIAARYRPAWILWENVAGVLSSNRGRDFGAFLGMLGELGYGFAYRVLDAQFFGVPQRRKRVFVVGYLGDWRPPAAVLFESESLRGDSPPRRETGQGTTYDVAPSLTGSGRGVDRPGESRGQDPLVAHFLRGEGFDASEDGTGRSTPLVAFSCKDHGADAGEIAPTLRAMGHDGSHANAGGQVAVAYAIQGAATRENPNSGPGEIGVRSDDCAYTLEARAEVQAVAFKGAADWAVRRLTPRECERLMGVADDYTLIPYRGKPMADGNRYKMIGNSWAVPCVRWIGERIDAVRAAMEQET